MSKGALFVIGFVFCVHAVSASDQTTKWILPKEWFGKKLQNSVYYENEIALTYGSDCENYTISFYKDNDCWMQSMKIAKDDSITYKRSLPIDIDDPVSQSLLTCLYGSVDAYIEDIKLDKQNDLLTINSLGSNYSLFSYVTSPTFKAYMKKKSSGLHENVG